MDIDYNIVNNEILKLQKSQIEYNIFECILRIFDKTFSLLNKDTLNQKSISLKNKLSADLISLKIYNKFDFNLKKQKNFIYNNLVSNNIYYNYNNNIIKYISYYINHNILIIDGSKYNFINEYNSKLNTIILIKKTKLYFPYIYNKSIYINIYNDTQINKIISYFKLNKKIIIDENIDIHKQLNKLKYLKLTELQEIASEYNICLYSSNKLKNKNILFKELYEYIYNNN